MENTKKIEAVDSGIKVGGIVAVTPIHRVSEQDLISVLFGINKTTFIGFSAVTVPSMNKTGNRFFGKVEKVSPRVNALIGYQYEGMVNNAQKRELGSTIRDALIENGVPESVIRVFDNDLDDIVEASHREFTAAKLPWGKHMTNPTDNVLNRVLINHTPKKTGKYTVYAQMAIMHSRQPIYRWVDTKVELTEAEKSEMKAFFPDKTEGGRQGLSKPYIIRSYEIGNITDIVIDKTQYILS